MLTAFRMTAHNAKKDNIKIIKGYCYDKFGNIPFLTSKR